ncbi:MAG TPA: R3H domain-containing nucleic acid-binding protein [Ktedonobacteraceae bacterium]|nr:R3H domain-containing nucleic acid-binding protein [Ktedonobacteraceae bacterium]
MQHVITDDLEALLAALPPDIHDAVNRLENRGDLLEIVMDLGRYAEGRFPEGEVILSSQPITYADLEYVVERIGEFGDDNRAGIERTLHRISALRNRKGKIVGLTCRIGRAVLGSIALIRDIVEQGQSILILGRPGVGKTTLLREIARVLADESNKRVVVVDTSNEIAGDGDIPHPGIGRARRMQVARTVEQHSVMIEAVENHMPQVIVIDEIGTELEAAAARTIAERGVQLVATAHGNSLNNLLMNPTLSDLVGGIQTVTLGDEEARRRHTQKSILERKAPPTFDVVVEQQSWEELVVHRDVADTVDNMLRGQIIVAEERTRDEDTDRITVRRVSSGGMEIPTWGVGGLTRQNDFERSGGNEWNQFRQSRQPNQPGPGLRGGNGGNGGNGNADRFRSRPAGQAQVMAFEPGPRVSGSNASVGSGSPRGGASIANMQPALSHLAPTGTSPADVEHRAPMTLIASGRPVLNRLEETDEDEQQVSIMKTVRIYPFGVSRDRLAEAARKLRVPIIVTNNQGDADAVVTLKNYYRRQPERLQQAEQDRKAIIILKNNTIAQMQHALAHIFDIPTSDFADDQNEASDDGNGSDPEHDDPTMRALLETEDVIHQVLNKDLTTAELAPANAYIRRLQHQMATRYNLISRSRGKEPNRRVKLFRSRD